MIDYIYALKETSIYREMIEEFEAMITDLIELELVCKKHFGSGKYIEKIKWLKEAL